MTTNAETQTETEIRRQLSWALSDECTRSVVDYFGEATDSVASLADLAEYVAGQRDEMPPDQVATRLHHFGLPKLADVGVVEYDARTKTVRYWGHSSLEDV